MKLTELKSHLARHPNLNIRFALPNGEQVAAHAHVTEVALIDKKFVDCGGTFVQIRFVVCKVGSPMTSTIG